ncbi:hypothetical protein E2C01_019346 [Portunus trituberculatus]|uniref:Uncharacterized protein n=1 Tax=Portunus trituberculatus TaxID=210409 RepID=A0A5B7DWY5_PORTR|nr:hypothetical protein [Portunus trituberculatus]
MGPLGRAVVVRGRLDQNPTHTVPFLCDTLRATQTGGWGNDGREEGDTFPSITFPPHPPLLSLYSLTCTSASPAPHGHQRPTRVLEEAQRGAVG